MINVMLNVCPLSLIADKLETDEMLRLNNELPTYDKTFSIVQRDTDSQETSNENYLHVLAV